MADHDDVDRRWRAANRVPAGITHTDASRELMDELRARIVAADRLAEEPRRSRLRLPVARRSVVLGSVIGLLAVGGAAAATTILASGTIGAPGFCHAAVKATASIPFPAGDQAWRNWALLESANPKLGTTLKEACADPRQRYVAKAPGGGAYLEPIPVYQGEVTTSAFCAWVSEWLNAESAGDTAAASAAASEISGTLQWPRARAADHYLEFGFGPAQRAVQAGDVADVRLMFAPVGTRSRMPYTGFCTLLVPPANSDNGTVFVLHPGQHA